MSNSEESRLVAALQHLRKTHDISIAEMARRSGLPKGSMESYFRGHKPGYDALIAIADAFRVPIDWLAGRRELEKGQIEEVVRAAAELEVVSLLRSMEERERTGEPLFHDGKVGGRTAIEDYAAGLARLIAQRAGFLVDHYPNTAVRMFKDDAL